MAETKVKKPYADWGWYTDEYRGTVLEEETFPRYARFGTNMVDAMTYGNITSNDQVIDCVKDAVCAVAELAQNYYSSTVSAEDGRGVKSESNDGYSVSFDETLSTSESLQNECRNTVRLYLANTGLLFRGVHNKPRRRWYFG